MDETASDAARFLDLAHARGDELFLDRLLVELLDQAGDLALSASST